MKLSTTGAALLPLAAVVSAIDFNANDDASIKSCSQQYASGLMSEYKYNAGDVPSSEVGYFPKPHYWWESGAIWGGLIEYTQIFGDTSYVKTVQQALVANYGPSNNVIMQDKRDQQGNDDQAFWCLATMSAAEYGFPEPADAPASYLEVTENCFKNITARWDTGSCGGGLKWQIYPENSYGYDYKNSISNGAAFALAARLARFTGKSEYADWAKTIYDWTAKVGLIGPNFEVFDGTDDKTNCASISDKTEWTYNNAMFLHGSAFMYDVTKGDSAWKDRVNGFLNRAGKFFSNPDGTADVMFEICEPGNKCNIDQLSFKAYLSRWMAKTAILAPFTKDKVTNYLTKSAVAAAKSCSGGSDGKTCGAKWYQGSFDDVTGLGQQLSAMEVTQALAMIKKGTLPGTGSASVPEPSSSSVAPSSTSSQAAPSSTKLATSQAASSSTKLATSQAAPSSTKLATTSAPAIISVSESKAAPSSTVVATSNAPVVLSSSSKVIESKPSETKPAETKPTETKPAETKPAISASAPAADAPAPTSISPATPTLGGELKPSNCSCTGKKTVTVYVPPTTATAPAASTPCTTKTTLTVYVPASSPVASAPVASAPAASSPVVPPVVPTTSRNATVLPTAPPTNTSAPTLFPGAASGTQLAGSTLFVAVALAALSALL